MVWSIRKGCIQCGSPLTTSKEKITRTCNYCANKALEGFQDMSEGKFKEGFNKVLSTNKGIDSIKEGIIRDRMNRSLTKRRKKLEKHLRKKGLSEDEIISGLEAFDNVNKE